MAAAKTKRITLKLKGLAAPADDFGRLRFLLLDELNDRRKDFSKETLERFISADICRPFKTWDARDNVVGEFWAVMPKRKYKYWAEVYPPMRGREVVVEVALRKYSFIPQGKGEAISGVALDLIDITLLADAAEKKTSDTTRA